VIGESNYPIIHGGGKGEKYKTRGFNPLIEWNQQ